MECVKASVWHGCTVQIITIPNYRTTISLHKLFPFSLGAFSASDAHSEVFHHFLASQGEALNLLPLLEGVGQCR